MNDHVSSTCAFLIFTLSIHWSSSQRTERQHAPTNVFFDHDCASVSTHALGMQAIGLKSACRWTTFLAFIGTHGEASNFMYMRCGRVGAQEHIQSIWEKLHSEKLGRLKCCFQTCLPSRHWALAREETPKWRPAPVWIYCFSLCVKIWWTSCPVQRKLLSCNKRNGRSRFNARRALPVVSWFWPKMWRKTTHVCPAAGSSIRQALKIKKAILWAWGCGLSHDTAILLNLASWSKKSVERIRKVNTHSYLNLKRNYLQKKLHTRMWKCYIGIFVWFWIIRRDFWWMHLRLQVATTVLRQPCKRQRSWLQYWIKLWQPTRPLKTFITHGYIPKDAESNNNEKPTCEKIQSIVSGTNRDQSSVFDFSWNVFEGMSKTKLTDTRIWKIQNKHFRLDQ